LNAGKVGANHRELNEDVVNQVFGLLLIVLGKLKRPVPQPLVTLKEDIFVAVGL
jgi:hypothetical protein